MVPVSNNSTFAEQSQQNSIAYAMYVIRVISCFATVMNICVLSLMIRLKKSFRNYSYWFQISVLASEDSLNGLASFALTFYDLKLFKTNYIACSVLLFAYMCAQINTLLAICCICISRFRNIVNINKPGESRSGYRQEISIVLATGFGIIYASLPFLTLNIKTDSLPMCTPHIFGSQRKVYALYSSLGLFVPLIVINILYATSLVKLKHANVTVEPMSHHVVSNLSSSSQIKKETSANKFSSHVETGRDGLQIKQSIQSNEQQAAQQGASGNKVTNFAFIKRSRSISNPSSNLQATLEGCSSPATYSSLMPVQKRQLQYSQTSRNTQNAQCRAIKLLGTILFTCNISTIIPAAFLLRGVIAPVNRTAGSPFVGIVVLSLNSFVDAFVYGLYAKEIRTYLRSKLSKFRLLLCC